MSDSVSSMTEPELGRNRTKYKPVAQKTAKKASTPFIPVTASAVGISSRPNAPYVKTQTIM